MAVDTLPGAAPAITTLRARAQAGRPYSIALLDVEMPGLSGLELARMIRDTPETARITSLIAALDRSLTVVIVEHDMDVVFRLADRISVLHEGRVLADGTPAQVRGDRTVNEVYLGKVIA